MFTESLRTETEVLSLYASLAGGVLWHSLGGYTLRVWNDLLEYLIGKAPCETIEEVRRI